MTNSEEPRGPENLEPDPIVEKLVSDPSQPAEPAVMLEGFLGPSARNGYVRLYTTQSLNRYAEFPEEDVLHREPIPIEQHPFEGLESTKLWVRQNAQVTYTRIESRQVQASFLEGDITTGPTAATGPTAGVLGAEVAGALPDPPIAPTGLILCRTPTHGPGCGSKWCSWWC